MSCTQNADELQSISANGLWAKRLMDDETKPACVLAVGFLIHWFANSDGTLFLWNEQIMKKTGLSEPTVTKAKRWLCENGYITISGGNGRGVKTQIALAFDPEKAKKCEVISFVKAKPALVKNPERPKKDVSKGQKIVGHILDKTPEVEERTPLPPKGGRTAWAEMLNPQMHDNASHGVDLQPDGSVVLFNGTQAKWLEAFGGDEARLDLALEEAAGQIRLNSNTPAHLQVKRTLGRIAGDIRDRDKRYQQAAGAKSKTAWLTTAELEAIAAEVSQ